MGHVCIAHPSEPQFCHIQYECNNVPFIGILGFPCGSDGKKSTCNAGDPLSPFTILFKKKV